MKKFAVLVSLALVSTVSVSASFDCRKASTFVEKAICSDSLLGRLDESLSENYNDMMASNIGASARKDLRSTQRKWLSERNKCQNSKCVEKMYRKRMDGVFPPFRAVLKSRSYAAMANFWIGVIPPSAMLGRS